MTAVQMLRKARALIKKGFCKEALARDAAGNQVSPTSRTAVQWCALGALDRAGRGDAGWQAEEFLVDAIPGRSHAKDLVDYNNAARRTKAQMLRLFDRAIARAQDPRPNP